MELSRRGVLARHEKYSNVCEFYSNLGRKSREFENEVVERIKLNMTNYIMFPLFVIE